MQKFRIIMPNIILLLTSTFLLMTCTPNSVSRQTEELVDFHLNQIKSVAGFEDVKVQSINPIYALIGDTAKTYDVKLVSSKGENRGYLIVNLEKNEFPIPEFTNEGPCLTEQFKQLLKEDNYKIVWVNPTYSIALDNENHILARIGTDPVPNESDSTIPSKISEKKYLENLKVFQTKWLTQNKLAIQESWQFVSSGGKKSSDLVEDQPTGDYSIDYADGYERSPKFKQIPPNTGANNKSYPSGCGPTAWGIFIAWHDLIWTPELLRGSQNINDNSSSWGNPSESEWNTYIDRIMMDIGKKQYLDNHDCFWVSGNVGITHDSNMKKGFDYIKNKRGFEFTGKASGGNNLQKVYDCISIDRRPVIIKTPNHFCVAAGFWYHNSGNNHYILINTGWGYYKWIKTQYLEKYWYLKNIVPNDQNKLIVTTTTMNINRGFGPTLCTSGTQTGLDEKLWVFFLLANGKIGYVNCIGNQWPNFSQFRAINVQAIYPPSVIADKNSTRLILLYVDQTHKMHLLYWEEKYNNWLPLVSPSHLTTTIRPALAGNFGNWLTIAFSDNEYGVQVISTCGDLQREFPHPWPEDLYRINNDKYWHQVDPLGTQFGVNMIYYKDDLILTWIRNTGYNNKLFCMVSELDGSKIEYIYSTYQISQSVKLLTSNETLFSLGSYSDGINIYKLSVYRADTTNSHMGGRTTQHVTPAHLNFAGIASLLENCIDEASLGFQELEEGRHPQLVLSWLGTGALSPINLRRLSIDVSPNFINYIGYPY